MTRPTALTIGNFDGVHLGHAALVRRARALVGPAGRVVALAFYPHPATRLKPDAAPALLSTPAQREAWLRAVGADEVDRLEPTPELLSLSPEAFIRAKVERYTLRPGHSWIVEGDDFHFGHKRAGNVLTLAQLGETFGFRAEVVPPVDVALLDHQIVRASSSIVRWLVGHGRVRDAALVLGRPYELEGEVVRGDQRGRTIGFPTANVATPHLLPADGVYAGLADLPGGHAIPAAINIGTRPTFQGQDRRLEVHLLGHDQPWTPPAALPDYGWTIRVQFTAWLRDQVRFASPAHLVDQLSRDCGRARHGAGAPA